MNSEKILKEKTKKISIIEGSFYSISEGLGLRNISTYALTLNASNNFIAMLTSIPALLGNVSQILSKKFIKKTTRKKAISRLVFMQAIFWILMIIPGVIFLFEKNLSKISLTLLIIFYTILIIFGAVSGPIWNSWMKDIVSEKELGNYFSKRNKILLAVVIFSSILGGLFLDLMKNKEKLIIGFFILFFISFIARSISAWLFTKKYEPKYKQNQKEEFSLKQFINNMPYNNFGRFVFFFATLNFFVAIASPFFVVYILKIKGFSYTFYALTLLTMTVFSVLTMSFWGRISDREGNMKIFRFALVGISLIPFIYFISNFFNNKIIVGSLIILAEAISGFCWGGFNLASSNFVFKIVSREKMVYCTSYMNVINGFFVFLGASIGGLLASLHIFHLNPILIVFLISFFGRIITFLFILTNVKEKKEKSSYNNQIMLTQIFNIPRSFFNNRGEFVLLFIKKFIRK